MGLLLLLVLAYVMGSVPWGLVVARVFCNIDPRTAGSRNTGATNVARLCGFGYGVATLFCDLAKGMLPVLLALDAGFGALGITLVGTAAVLGHVYSCFMHFRGGKAVATSIGVFLPLAFFPLLFAAMLCIFVIWRTEYVSAGSLTLVGTLPVFLAIWGFWQWLPLALFFLVLVALRHRENIARLLGGTEKPWLKSR